MWQATKFAHSLRRSLWAEHLGLEDYLFEEQSCEFVNDRLGDPVCKQNFELWQNTAKQNTAVCNKYFLEQPANHHPTVKLYNYCREVADTEIMGNHKEHEKAVKELECYMEEMVSQGKIDAQAKLVLQPRGDRVAALSRIQGHLYEYPIDFLSDDLQAGNLKPDTISAEGVLPAKTFT